jgi:hypothetical protein
LLHSLCETFFTHHLHGQRQAANQRKCSTRSEQVIHRITSRAADVLQGNFQASFGFGSSTSFIDDSALDPELRVIVKKLSKRDNVTKQRALEELAGFLSQNVSADFMETWEKLFQRLAIDHDRKVRENCFVVLNQIINSDSKLLAPILKKIAGPWISARFDSSKEVAQIAANSFEKAFPKKLEQVLKVCQGVIIDYVSKMILDETPETLSDKRYVSEEDMLGKYNRCVSASIDCVGFLVEQLDQSTRQSAEEKYANLFEKRFWEMAHHQQGSIRAAFYRFLKVCCQKGIDVVDAHKEQLAKQYLTKVFLDKEPSIHPFMWDSLLLISKHCSDVWLQETKKPIVPKLFNFLNQGTFGSPSVSYPCFLPLLAHIPLQLMINTAHFVSDFFDAFWAGRVLIDKIFCQVFLNSYMECCLYFLKNDAFSSSHQAILTQHLLVPIISLSEKRSDRFSDGDISKYSSKWLVDALVLFNGSVISEISQKWIELAKASSNTQWILDLCAEMGSRNLNLPLVEGVFQASVIHRIAQSQIVMLRSLLDVSSISLPLEVIHDGLELMKNLNVDDPKVAETFVIFISKSTSDLEQESLISWKGLVEKILQSTNPVESLHEVVKTIATHPHPSFVPLIPLDRYLLSLFRANAHNSQLYELLGDLLALDDSLLFETAKEELSEMISSVFRMYLDQVLIIPSRNLHAIPYAVIDQTSFVLEVLNIATRNGSNEYMTNLVHLNLVNILLVAHSHPTTVASLQWTESNSTSIVQCVDAIRNRAFELSKRVRPTDSQNLVSKWSSQFMEEFMNLQHSASSADFVEIVADLLSICMENVQETLIKGILPATEFFVTNFGVFDNQSCLTSIVDPVSTWSRPLSTPSFQIEYDHDGLSRYARWMLLLFALLKSKDTKRFISLDYFLELTRFVIVCEDHLHTTTNLFEVDLIAHTQLVLDDWKDMILQQNRDDFWSLLEQKDNVFGLALQQCITSKGIMDGRIARKLIQTVIDEIGVTNQAIQLAISLYRNANYVSCLALLEPMLPLCDVDFLDQFHPVFSEPVLKIKRSTINETSDTPLAQVIIFSNYLSAIKHVNADMDDEIRNSILRWVRTQYDAIVSSRGKDDNLSEQLVVFDTQVARICDYLVSVSIHEHIDYGLNMSRFLCDLMYHLIQVSKKITMDEAGKVYVFHILKYWSVLEEAAENSSMWTRVSDIADEVHKLIVQLFFVVGEPSESTSVGLQALQTLAGEMVLQLDYEDHVRQYLANETKLFAMIMTNCEQIQKTVFETLRRITYQRVQEHSLTIAMSSKKKKYGISPALVDLLSLPKPEETYQFFGHGLGWLLFFDHFHEANFDLRQMYTMELKESGILGTFLDILFGVVGVDSKKPVLNMKNWELDEYYVSGYDGDIPSSIPLLYAHLYYKALKSIPSLVRSWYSDCSNRQLVLAVESFTEKYISPSLIAKEFEIVQNQSDSEMTIRINTSQNEITAGYKIEEAGLDIVLKLPRVYPLKVVEVGSGTAGGRQAGIQESRWRSWLLSVSAVMVAQNGTILDALNLFKKNVNLHFEGMEDCAICYSIISAVDRSTPQKQCRVCKHIFHGSCVFKV